MEPTRFLSGTQEENTLWVCVCVRTCGSAHDSEDQRTTSGYSSTAHLWFKTESLTAWNLAHQPPSSLPCYGNHSHAPPNLALLCSSSWPDSCYVSDTSLGTARAG